MHIKNAILLLGILMTGLYGRSQMRSLKELADTSDTGWGIVRELLQKATNKVEVLPRDSARACDAVYRSQLAVQTTLGAVEYMTGGIMIDGGWIRIIGSGSSRLPRNLPEWNKGKSVAGYGHKAAFYLVADDVLGGFFALNWGGLSNDDLGKVFYLAPDNLQWESTGNNYGQFIEFCFTGNLNEFYKDLRWDHWHQQVDTLSGNSAFHIMPPLWSKEGKDINKDVRHVVPVEEIYSYTLDLQRQMLKEQK